MLVRKKKKWEKKIGERDGKIGNKEGKDRRRDHKGKKTEQNGHGKELLFENMLSILLSMSSKSTNTNYKDIKEIEAYVTKKCIIYFCNAGQKYFYLS